jgi:transcription elongation factor GreA
MANNKNQEEPLFITQERYTELEQELSERVANQKVIALEIKEARDLGDLRENDPYTKAMRKKEINDARIDEISEILDKAEIIEVKATENSLIEIGFKVVIQNLSTKAERTISLVGKSATGDADPQEGKVSIDSPIGAAVYKKKSRRYFCY